MNILALKQLDTAIRDTSKDYHLKVSIELSTVLLPTIKVTKLRGCSVCFTILLCRFHQKLLLFQVVERPVVCHSTRSRHLQYFFKQEPAFNPI